MLKELRIKNLALIESLTVDFGSGLVAMTGETGAGKSIIIQAINLLQGARAGGDLVRNGADKAGVEALFVVEVDNAVGARLAELDIDFDGEILIRRVIRTAGGSRFYLNGAMTTAAVLGEISASLLSLASQHEHQRLLQSSFQLDFIDAVGGLDPDRQKLSEVFHRYKEVSRCHDELIAAREERGRKRDFLAFQVEEIEAAKLVSGEDEKLARERDVLKAGDTLRRLGRESMNTINGRALDDIGVLKRNLEKMAALDPVFGQVSESMAEIYFLLEEKVGELRAYLETISDDPGRLEEIGGRIDIIQGLKRKYGPGIDDIIAFGLQAAQDLAEIDNSDERLTDLARQRAALAADLIARAAALSRARSRAAGRISTQVGEELQALCLENASFAVTGMVGEKGGIDDIGPGGWDCPEFIFSANPGEEMRPLARVASGGELSRVMLALKCAMARRDRVDTVIFDEVDSGIGGRAAEAVGRKIRELADHHQVVCITHLPQIAARADQHLLVTKEVVGDRTRTGISSLAPQARKEELARMLDGDTAGTSTLAYVDELMARGGRR